MAMQVSVIIITKDEQPRLRLCVLALGRQTVHWQNDAEIILVDDGSAIPVGAADIPSDGPQPQIIRHERSRGRSASRNEGPKLPEAGGCSFSTVMCCYRPMRFAAWTLGRR